MPRLLPSLLGSARRTLVLLLVFWQIGFVNAEALWMAVAHVPHPHLLEQSQSANPETLNPLQLDFSQQVPEASHHCDICHGHCAHFAVLPSMTQIEPWYTDRSRIACSIGLYVSVHAKSLYRPPSLLL